MSDSYHHGDLRRALVDAAVAAIAESGPAALSLRAVAKRAGVSHAAPAHHFRDKTGLLTAVAAEGYERFADALGRAWEATGDFREVGIAYVRFAIDNRGYIAVMFRPEMLREDDPALAGARRRAGEVLLTGASSVSSDGPSAAVAAWSIVHGFADLLLTGNLGPWITPEPESLLRSVLGHLDFNK
jgi:AcrR family transcriptional regulator